MTRFTYQWTVLMVMVDAPDRRVEPALAQRLYTFLLRIIEPCPGPLVMHDSIPISGTNASGNWVKRILTKNRKRIKCLPPPQAAESAPDIAKRLRGPGIQWPPHKCRSCTAS